MSWFLMAQCKSIYPHLGCLYNDAETTEPREDDVVDERALKHVKKTMNLTTYCTTEHTIEHHNQLSLRTLKSRRDNPGRERFVFLYAGVAAF